MAILNEPSGSVPRPPYLLKAFSASTGTDPK
jgi:hypothetical protein